MPTKMLAWITFTLAACILVAEPAFACCHGHSSVPRPSTTPIPRIDVPRIDIPRVRPGHSTIGPAQRDIPVMRAAPPRTRTQPPTTATRQGKDPEDKTPASTDNILGPAIQNILGGALPPIAAHVPGPAAWQVNPGGGRPTFTGAGAAQVVGMILVNSLINNINHFQPADQQVSQSDVNGMLVAANTMIAGSLTLAGATTAAAGIVPAAIAAAAAGAGTAISIGIESTFSDANVGTVVDPSWGTWVRAGLNGISAGGLAAGATYAAAGLAGTAMAVPAGTVAVVIGAATATAYVARPAIDAAVNTVFDGLLAGWDAVTGGP